MSSYPILNNKPIDQWKVTELKEELRRRKLPVSGLKEALVRKLDEALRQEMEMKSDEEVIVSKLESEFDDSNEKVVEGDAEVGGADIVDYTNEKDQGDARAFDDNDGSKLPVNQGRQYLESPTYVNPDYMKTEASVLAEETTAILTDEAAPVLTEEETAPTPVVGTAPAAMEETVPSVAEEISLVSSVKDDDSEKQIGITNNESTEVLRTSEKHEHFEPVTSDINVNLSVPSVKGDVNAIKSMTCYSSTGQDSLNNEKHDVLKPDTKDAKLNLLVPENQVSVVCPGLGSQAKSESLPTDSMSIIKNNKLKDNLNANDFHIEQEVIKPEMVQPSSSSGPVLPISGDPHHNNDHKELVKNLLFVHELNCGSAKVHDINQKEDSLDVGSPEKLNLERSSGDESMEEDFVQNKIYEHSVKSEELGKPHTSEGIIDSVTSPFNPGKENAVEKHEIEPTDTPGKRKHEVTELVEKNENIKRQRRWNSETINVPDHQVANPSASSLPKNEFHPAPRRTFTSFDQKPDEESPKERIVPPPQNSATTSLRIDRFLRPFTLKAVQELLGKTGKICDFWMDHIKTHCYVTFSSVEEAVATRNAVYNLRWPLNGGNLLIAEFVDPKEVKERIDPPQQASAPIPSEPIAPSSTAPKTPYLQQHQPSRQSSLRQQLPPPPPLPEKERLPPALTPKPEPPPLTLDDIFLRTKATPRIYYLPLTDDQVAAKLAAQGKGVKN